MSKTYLRFAVFIIIGLYAIVTYQNCSPVKFNSNRLPQNIADQGSICTTQSMLGGPSEVFVGDEASYTYQDCNASTASWDFESDGQKVLNGALSVTHVYSTVGKHVITTQGIASNGSRLNVLTHEVQVKYRTCSYNGNSYTNGSKISGYLQSHGTCEQSCQSSDSFCDGIKGEFVPTIVSSCQEATGCPCKYRWTAVYDQTTCPGACGITSHYAFTKWKCEHQDSTGAWVSCTTQEESSPSLCSGPKPSNPPPQSQWPTCSTRACQSCDNIAQPGVRIPSGQTLSLYKPSLGCDQACDAETRLCKDGQYYLSDGTTRSDFDLGFALASCDSHACRSCVTPEGVLAHNQSKILYKSVAPTCGQDCSPQQRTCRDGKLYNEAGTEEAYNSLNSKATCDSPVCPKGCSFTLVDGTKELITNLNHGDTFSPAYMSGSVPKGSSCDSFKIKCDNGVLKNDSSGAVLTPPVRVFASCCTVEEITQIVKTMKESVDTTNHQISVDCHDSWVDVNWASCNSATWPDMSYLGISWVGRSFQSCQDLAPTYSDGVMTRFKVTCGSRSCVKRGYATGVVETSAGVESPPLMPLSGSLNSSATLHCRKIVPPPDVNPACQKVIGENPTVVRFDHILVSDVVAAAQAYYGASNTCTSIPPWNIDQVKTCGKAYCMQLHQNYTDGFLVELSSGTVSLYCFRDEAAYQELWK